MSDPEAQNYHGHYPPISREPSFVEFRTRGVAMASFENLVALANYEERLREARKIVWRDRGEKPVELNDLWDCLEHAGRGGLRAGGLAFAIRSGVNLILLMTRIKRLPRNMRFALIRHAAFGPDSMRFATMLGSFVAIYKFILNALPIFLPEPIRRHRHGASRSQSLLRSVFLEESPPDSPFHEDDVEHDLQIAEQGRTKGSRHARLSMSAQAHQIWVRKRTRRWYSVLAGAVAGGIAILFEKRDRRAGIAQQMFVRGLQGSYNAFSSKHGIHIPHGDILLFSLCCGQIMYSWLLHPETLPHSYNTWILKASRVYGETVSMFHDIVNEGTFKLSDLESLIARKNTTPANRAEMLELLASASLPPPARSYGQRFPRCAAVHPWLDSCTLVQVERFLDVFRWMFPIYGALHLVPLLLFRRQRVAKDPVGMLLRAVWGTTRSSAFLGAFVIIFQGVLCFKHNLYNALSALRSSRASARAHPLIAVLAQQLPQGPIELLISKSSYWVLGFMTGLSLFVEEKHRREELAMYVLPKALESAWIMARGRGLVFRTGEVGEVLFTAMAMAMVMSTYQNDPQHLSGLVRRILYQFVGPN
ncbi:hypothetical protein BKA93DRAFT_823559 [Sparassis latifolia]